VDTRFPAKVALYFALLANQRQPLPLNLPDPLRTDAQFLTDFPEGVLIPVPHA